MNWQHANEVARVRQANLLSAKVIGKNEANKLVNEWMPRIFSALEKWVGQKVSLVSGGTPHKLAKEISELNFPNHLHAVQIRIEFGTYNAYAHFRYTANVSDSVHYEDTAVYLGKMQNGLILENLDGQKQFTLRRTDYTVQGVLDARKAVEDAESVLSDAKSKLENFGTHDNH